MKEYMMQLTPEDKVRIKKAVQEASDSMYRVEAEKTLYKDIIDNLFDTFKIPKKNLNRMVRIYHKQNYHEEVALQHEFEELYESVTGANENNE
jgi:hypothetical protein